VQVAQRAPVRRDPPRYGERRDNSGPRTAPIVIAGRTEWATTAQANQYHSNYALAQSMTQSRSALQPKLAARIDDCR
jgi:hypothetical protein